MIDYYVIEIDLNGRSSKVARFPNEASACGFAHSVAATSSVTKAVYAVTTGEVTAAYPSFAVCEKESVEVPQSGDLFGEEG